MTATTATDPAKRVAVVTGGAGAIGGAIAARLAPDHTVVVLDRKGDVAVDLSEPDDVRRAAQLVLERYGRCDVFVHCAGAFDFTNLAEFELAAWRYVQAVNVEAALWLAKAFNSGNGRAEVRPDRVHHIGHGLGPTDQAGRLQPTCRRPVPAR
jgi:NAD(P)-dependent dehydrogenase (short-subunit alcohol dehydrogenase family)